MIQPEQLALYPAAMALLAKHAPQPTPVPCAHGCTAVCPLEIYCSDACRDAAWNEYHAALCPRAPDRAHPLPQLHALCAYVVGPDPVAGAWRVAARVLTAHPRRCRLPARPVIRARRVRRTNPMMVARAFATVAQRLQRAPPGTTVVRIVVVGALLERHKTSPAEVGVGCVHWGT